MTTDNGQAQAEEILNRIIANRKIWLHQSGTGMFVMYGEDGQNLYIPIWDTERCAADAIKDDKTSVTSMFFNELVEWIKELKNDGIDFAVGSEEIGLYRIPASVMGDMIKPYVTARFTDSESDDDDE